MKKKNLNKLFLLFLTAVFTLAASGAITPKKCQADEIITVNISPNIINLDSDDHTFGVHTSIPYSVVNIEEILLLCPDETELQPEICYADSRGYLVARFNTADLNTGCDLVIGDYNTFILEGETLIDSEFFSGAGEVLIIESQPQFQKGNGPRSNPVKNCPNR